MFLKAAKEEIIKGGLADGAKPSQFLRKELREGIKVEMEHTDDKAMAKEIAMDHLAEHPEYYTHLKEMEDKLKKTAKAIHFAYRNIHKGKGSDNHHFSLRNKSTGRVDKRGQNFILQDAVFKVSEKGNQRVRDEKRKNVHAGIQGSVYKGKKAKDLEWEPAKYNPYTHKNFQDSDGKNLISAEFVKLTPHGVFVPKNDDLKKTASSFDPLFQAIRKRIISPLIVGNRLKKAVSDNTHQIAEAVHQAAKETGSTIEKSPEIVTEALDDIALAEAGRDPNGPAFQYPTDPIAQAVEKIGEFKSKAQRRKFYALKAEGKMDQKTIDEWEADTKNKKKLPERVGEDNMEKKSFISVIPNFGEAISNPGDDLTNTLSALGFLGMGAGFGMGDVGKSFGLSKVAGGPGSGVSGDNTKFIDMPLTPHITIMKRTAFMNSKKPFLKDKKIKMTKIKYVGQTKFVPKKLDKMVKALKDGETWPCEKAIDVTVDKNGDYAVLDGHHRYLACKEAGKDSIKCNVYTVKDSDKSEESLTKEANLGSMFGALGSSLAKAPGRLKGYFSGKSLGDTAKDLGKGTYNLAFGGKTVNNKWDPLYGVKAMGRARDQYTSGPLKGMYKYDKAGDHVLKEGPRDWLGFAKDEIAGASRTRGDLMAKEIAKKKGMNVGEYLGQAGRKQKQRLADVNQMSATEFMKRYPRLAANYYGRNAVQKGLVVGFPALSLYDTVTGKNSDPNSSRLGNTLGGLAETAGWALTGPLGLVGATGTVMGGRALAEGAGNLISSPEQGPNLRMKSVRSPGSQAYDTIAANAPGPVGNMMYGARDMANPMNYVGV
jgi:uncharacterized ParB-like nuclease family protein